MKTKLLLMSFLMLLTAATFAQITTTPAGIAIQGIARDNNNTARANDNLSLKFTIYSVANPTLFTVTKALVTDEFGVFSTTIEPGAANYVAMAADNCSLKIEDGTTLISDEPLKAVPYAISANNGVPTGSIMPFVGTTAPAGWVLCDGRSILTVPGSAALRTLLGISNVPNLNGMFLRGTGSATTGQTGPALNAIQQDDIQAHLHAAGTLVTNSAGNHTHAWTKGLDNRTSGAPIMNSSDHEFITGGGIFGIPTDVMANAGAHTHTVTGSTANTGGTETRPVNYGVNYIIKL
jgi:Phage Tail Collar Domain.